MATPSAECYMERLMDSRYYRYKQLRKEHHRRQLSQVRQQRLLNFESVQQDHLEHELLHEVDSNHDSLFEHHSLETISKMIQEGNEEVVVELARSTDKLCSLLDACSFNDWQHLCQILTSLLEILEDPAARFVVMQSHSAVILAGLSFVNSKAMFKLEIIDVVLSYCRIACLYLDCIGRTEMSALARIMSDRLIAYEPGSSVSDQLGACIDTLETILSQQDNITHTKDTRELARRCQVKVLKNTCLKQCLTNDKRALLALVGIIQQSEDALRLLLRISNMLVDEGLIRMFLQEFQIEVPLTRILERNSQFSAAAKRYAIRLINNLMQLWLKIQEVNALPMLRFLSAEFLADSSQLSFETVECIANLLCCATQPIIFQTFCQFKGLEMFAYVLGDASFAPTDSVCSVVEACTCVLQRIGSECAALFRELIFMVSSIYYKSEHSKLTERCAALLETARQFTELERDFSYCENSSVRR